MRDIRLYRIYTEDKNRAEVQKIASSRFEAFTLLEGNGFWRGVREACLILEFVTDDAKLVGEVAQLIKTTNEQEAVLVVSSEVDSQLI